MLLKACIFILVIASILKTQSAIPSYIPFCVGDVCYIRVESSSGRNWTEAQQTCHNFISTLPIVDNPQNQLNFEAAARCLTTDEERQLGIWIGAIASYSKPISWTWFDGSSYPEKVMQSQEAYGKNYAFVQNTLTGVSAFAADPKERHSYICFYSTRVDQQRENSMCKSIEPRCYVKYDEQLSWFHARNNCLANGGDLASFTSISFLDGKIDSDRFWVALRSSQWNWQDAVTGVPSDVTYTLWNSGEPNDNASFCISTDAGDRFPNWKDHNCSQSLPFICQYTPLYPSLSICPTPSVTTLKHTDAASSSLLSSTTGKDRATKASVPAIIVLPTVSSTTPSVSSTTPSVSSNEVRQKNGTGSVDKIALGVGLGVGIGVPVILALVVVVIVISVRRKRRNSNSGGNTKLRETAASKNSQTTEENDRMEMSETQNGRPHYDNFSAQYATIPAAAVGPKLDAPSTQGTVYADLSFDQARSS